MKITFTFILTVLIITFAYANTNDVKKTENEKQIASSKNKKESVTKKELEYPGVGWKPTSKFDETSEQYPGVGWKPKNGDPKPENNPDAYPGVGWAPKK